MEAVVLAVRAGRAAQGRSGIHPHFCGNHGDPVGLGAARAAAEQPSTKSVVALVRAYANCPTKEGRRRRTEVARIKGQIDYYLNVREIVRKASGRA